MIDECENSLSDASNEREDAIKQMNNLRDEIKVWIEKLANISELLSKEDRIILNGMIQDAISKISYAARLDAKLINEIDDWIRSDRTGYEEIEGLSFNVDCAVKNACKQVRVVEKTGKKLSGKDFINVIKCKFTRSKTSKAKTGESQEQEKI